MSATLTPRILVLPNYPGDRDWFAVELAAGTTYEINLQGAETGRGTL